MTSPLHALARRRIVQSAASATLSGMVRTLPDSALTAGLATRVLGVLSNAGGTARDTAQALRLRLVDELDELHGASLRSRTLEARLRLDARLPADDVPAVVDELMSRAEALAADGGAHTKRELAAATDMVVDALVLTYHPTRVLSPAILPILRDEDPAFARVAGSPVFAWAPARGARRHPGDGQPTRLLVVTNQHLGFLEQALERWRSSDDVELQVLRLAPGSPEMRRVDVRAQVRAWLTRTPLAPIGRMASALEWADVVFCEWATAPASALTLTGTPARTVIRAHRFEVFREFMPLIAWEDVDELVTVASHIRRTLDHTVPGRAAHVSTDAVPLEVDLSDFARPKLPEAARTLAVVGYSGTIKDPSWALDVLEELRADDPSWRLLLVGDPTPQAEDRRTADYFRRFDETVAEAGEAVVRTGQVDDVAEVLRRASVIISSSQHEGIHTGVAEGVASGCLPVVRNWPDGVPVDAAATTYPPAWVVDTPAEAADRIRHAARADGGPAKSAEAREAVEWISRRFDPAGTAEAFDRAVFGPAAGHRTTHE